MGCGCNGNSMQVTSFGDLKCRTPIDPMEVIEFLEIVDGGTLPPVWTLAADYATPPGPSVWSVSPIAISALSTVETNHMDNLQMVHDAKAWTLAHQETTNTSSNAAIPLRKTVFCRAGSSWVNVIPFSFPSSPAIVKVQVSLLENSATRGDSAGTIPVLAFVSGSFGTTPKFRLTLKKQGRFSIGIQTISSAIPAGYSMFELDIVSL